MPQILLQTLFLLIRFNAQISFIHKIFIDFSKIIMEIEEKVEIIRLFSISLNAHEVRRQLYQKKLENGMFLSGTKPSIDKAGLPSVQAIIGLNKQFDETGSVLQNLQKRSFEIQSTYENIALLF